jgi:hypothetical protein
MPEETPNPTQAAQPHLQQASEVARRQPQCCPNHRLVHSIVSHHQRTAPAVLVSAAATDATAASRRLVVLQTQEVSVLLTVAFLVFP